MPILGVLEIIVQVYFAVHAARAGRYYWIFIILFFPLVGSLIYFFVEYLPEMRMGANIRKARKPAKPKSIEFLKRELEITDSVKNRMNLAEAYFHNHMFAESIDLLEKSLTGINANDLNIIKGLSYSYFHNGEYEKTIEYLRRYEKINSNSLPNDLRLLRAKAHDENGDWNTALDEYQAILNLTTGEEARCRYALLLKKKGDIDQANDIFASIIQNASHYPKQYAKFEKQWVKIAKAEIS